MSIDTVRLRRFAHDDRGAAAVIVALLLTVLLAFVAFATDLAMLYRDRAQLQAQADLTAMGIAAAPSQANQRLSAMLDGNGLAPEAATEVQLGRYRRNPALARDERFTPLSAGDPGINAVALRLEGTSPINFARVLTEEETLRIRGFATASRTAAASFTLGSRLLRLDLSQVAATLDRSFRVSANLTAGEVGVLADAQINMGALLDRLAQNLGYDPLNPADVLTLRPRVADLVRAMHEVGSTTVRGPLARLQSVPLSLEVEVGDLISASDRDLGQTLDDFINTIDVSALDLLLSVAAAVDATDPMPVAINSSVAGVLSASAQVSLQDEPAASGWVRVGETGTTLHSAAARMRTEVELAPALIGPLGAGVTATRLRLPLYVEVAGATATLTELSCAADDPRLPIARFSTATRPLSPGDGVSVAAVYLGELPPGAGRGPIPAGELEFADLLDVAITIDLPLLPDIRIDLLTFQIRSAVAIGQSQTEEIIFTGADLASGDLTQRFGSGDLLTSAVGSLLSPANTEIRVKPGQGLGLTGVVGSVIGGVLSALPDQILRNLTIPVDALLDAAIASAGLHLGEGELTLVGHHCEPVQLVR